MMQLQMPEFYACIFLMGHLNYLFHMDKAFCDTQYNKRSNLLHAPYIFHICYQRVYPMLELVLEILIRQGSQLHSRVIHIKIFVVALSLHLLSNLLQFNHLCRIAMFPNLYLREHKFYHLP